MEVWVFQLEDNKNMRADSNRHVGNNDDWLGREIPHGVAGGGGGHGICQHHGEEDRPGMDREGQTDRAKRSCDREERASEHARGKSRAEASLGGVAARPWIRWRGREVMVEERVGRGPELLIPCGELWEHLTPIREVAFTYVVKVQLGGQVT